MPQQSVSAWNVGLCLVLLSGIAMSCMYPMNWTLQDFDTRSQEADFIFLGQVAEMRPMPAQGDTPMSLGYSAVIDVRCVYKTPENDRDIGSSIVMTPVNFTSSCANTKMSTGSVYLIFLKRNSKGGFMPDEVNMEESQFPVDPEKVEFLKETFGAGRNADGPGCPGTTELPDLEPERLVDGGKGSKGQGRNDGLTTAVAGSLQHSTTKAKTETKGPENGSKKLTFTAIYALVSIGFISFLQ